MKKETTTKSKLWIWIVAAAVLLLAVGGVVLALVLGQDNGPAVDPVSGPRPDLYWNLDREFYTANSQTGLSTREADANGQFKMRFAYNGEIIEPVIIDKKLVNIIDTQEILGLTFDENGVVIGQTNVRELATEVGKKIYVKKATADTIEANSSMAMNGMELSLAMGQYAEIYDLRMDSETLGKKLAPTDLQVMDCITVYSNAAGDITHVYLLSNATRSKLYWRANMWVSSTVNRGGLDPDENGVYTLPFYCEGELVDIKTKDPELVDYYAELGKHSGFTGLIFDDDGYAIDAMGAAIGLAGQMTFYAMDVESVEGNYVKLKNNWSTSGAMNWEGTIPEETPVYDVSSWAYSEGVMGQKLSVKDLRVGDRITMFSDMEGNPIEIGITLRRVDLKPMFNNSSKYDAATRSTTRVKDADGYWVYTFIHEKGISKYKTKDQKLANFIDSYPERVFGIVTKGDMLVKAYEYECLYGYTRFSTALYVDAINGTILSCSDAKKANAYTAVLSEDYKVLDISGDSKEYGTKIKLQEGDCMISFRNTNKEVCMIYVTKRSMGGKLYVNTTPNTSRAPVTKDAAGKDIKNPYWEFEMTDINGKQVKLQLPTGKKDKDGVYANKYLQSRIDNASRGIIALEVSGKTIKDVHSVGNMASGNSIGTTIITKAGTAEFEFKTAAKPNDEASIYPGWTGKEGVKMINISATIKKYHGEKLSGGMKVNDVYYMVRNRANETVAMFLYGRGLHNDFYFVKNPMGVVNGETIREKDADGYYVFDVMYQGKATQVRTKDVKLATKLEGMRTGAALNLDKSKKPYTFTAVADYTGTNDAFKSEVSNWDVSAVSGSNVTLKLNIPTATTEVGVTKQLNISGAKIYNISPNAGANFGKTTKLQKNDRIRIFSDKNGKITYVLVTVRGGVKTAECEHCDKKVTWNPITATSGIGVGNGHYYIYDDYKVYGQLAVSSTAIDKYEVVVDLNGKTVTQDGNNSRMFMVAYEGKTLTLMDSVGTGVAEGYGNAPNGAAGNANIVQVSYGATLNILSGTYKMITAEGKVPAKQGGVLFSWSEGDYARNKVNIKGGTIIGGEILHPARTNGVDPLMSYAWSAGGALYGQKTDFNMSGGTIKDGHADRGGNVYLGSTATFTMTGGTIENGIAKNRGGNFYGATGSKITINGGKVIGGSIQGLEIPYKDETTGEDMVKLTGQQGGNIFGYNVTLASGEISGGTARTSGGNIFLLGRITETKNDKVVTVEGNSFTMTGGKLFGGNGPSGGGNIYVYGGDGLVAVSGGEIDASGVTLGPETTTVDGASVVVTTSTLSATGGKIGAVSIGRECAAIVGDDAQIDSLSMNAEAQPLSVAALSKNAKIVVNVEGRFGKAAEGAKNVDLEAYANNQIVSADKRIGNIYVEKDEKGVKWLVAGTKGNVDVIYGSIVEEALKMTENGVFDVAEGAEPTIVEARCPYCKETAQWAPLTEKILKGMTPGTNNNYVLDTHTHYYMAEDIKLPTVEKAATRLNAAKGATICLHLNAKTLDQNTDVSTMGAILVANGATLTIMGDGEVTGAGLTYNDASLGTLYSGGAIDVRGTVNILGGIYKSSRVDRPAVAAFGAAGNGVLINMYAGTITKGAAVNTSSAYSSNVRMHHSKHTFNMYGGTIEGGMAENGGNLRMHNGTFNMYAGTITGGSSKNLGGNICVRGGTFNLIDGEIIGGTTASSGGSIGLVSGTLNISGGKISGGTGVNGGLIYVYDGTLAITGGELNDGVSTNAGACIRIAGGTNTISGGTISGGVFVQANCKLTVSDDATIGAQWSGLQIAEGGELLIGKLSEKASLSITAEGKFAKAAEGEQIDLKALIGKQVVANDSKLCTISVVKDENGVEWLSAANKSAMEVYGHVVETSAQQTFTGDKVEAECAYCGKTVTWTGITQAMVNEALTETNNYILDTEAHTHYFLAEDIVMPFAGKKPTRFATTEGTTNAVCLHLNGKKLDQNAFELVKADENDPNSADVLVPVDAEGVLLVASGTTVNIMGNGTVTGTGTAVDLNAGTDKAASWIYSGALDVRGTANIFGGTYSSSHPERPAVALYRAAEGAAARDEQQAARVVNMFGGEITGGTQTTTDKPGSNNVYMNNGSHKFNLYGGKITGGKVDKTGGGNLYLKAGVFTMFGGEISGGHADNLGGNIVVRGGTLNVKGGTISGGKSNSSGGNIGLVSGTINLTGGSITGGNASNGGNIYIYGGTLNIRDKGVIENGVASKIGGNIAVSSDNTDKTLVMTGGAIKNGTAATGGNLHLSYTAQLAEGTARKTHKIMVTGGEISGGEGNVGGNVYFGAKNIVITSGDKLAETDKANDIAFFGIALDGGIEGASGNVIIRDGAKVSAANGGLVLSEGQMIVEGDLSQETAVSVSTRGMDEIAVSQVSAKMKQYLNKGYFTAANESRPVKVNNDNKLYVSAMQPAIDALGVQLNKDRPSDPEKPYHTAVCPACGVNAVWVPLNETAPGIIGDGEHKHYYLTDYLELNDKKYQSASGETVCIYLNGKDVIQFNSKTNYTGAFQISINSTMNLMGEGTVSGEGIVYNGLYGGGALDVRGICNMYGGTYMSNAGRPAVALFAASGATLNMYNGKIVGNADVAPTDVSSALRMYDKSHTFNMYGGEISGGKAVRGGNIIALGGTINLYEAKVDGSFYAKGATVNIKNGAKITATEGGLILDGTTINLANDLATGTVINVDTTGRTEKVVAAANDNASRYVNNIVKTVNGNASLKVNDKKQIVISYKSVEEATEDLTAVLATDVPTGQQYHQAVCPVCGENAQWVPLNDVAAGKIGSEHDHYYLEDALTLSSGKYQTDTGTTVCLFLNGKNLTQSANGVVLMNSIGTILNIMDTADNKGTVSGGGSSYTAAGALQGIGALDIRGTCNMYGGTYMSTNDKPAVALFAASNATLNMYGGKIVGNEEAASGDLSSNLRMYDASHTFNMYGGEITGGKATKGGNVHMTAGTFRLYKAEIDGGVYAGSDAIVAITNGAKIAATNGGLTVDGTKVLLMNDLAEGTEIYLSEAGRDGNALTQANDNAEKYLTDGIIKSNSAIGTLKVNEDKQFYFEYKSFEQLSADLSAVLATDAPEGKNHEAVCPVCEEVVEWVGITNQYVTGLTATGTNGDLYYLDAAGAGAYHYYLAENVTMPTTGTGRATRFQAANAGTTVCLYLNDKTLDQNATGSTEGVLKLSANTTTNIMDGPAKTGTVIGAGSSNSYGFTGGAIDVRGTVNIYGGTYKTSHAARPAVGLWSATSLVNMYDGKIVRGDNVATDTLVDGASNIFIRVSGATFNMHGGEITGGSAINGGNLYMMDGTFNLRGGKISGGAAEKGANAYMEKGTFRVYKAEIDGGFYAASGTVAITNGAKITATNGGLTLDTAKLYLTNDLAAGTDVYLTEANRVGNALSLTNENAARYLSDGIFKFDSFYGTLKVNDNDQIYFEYKSVAEFADELSALFATPIPEGKQYHEGYCPVCDEVAQWVSLTTAATVLDSGEHTHYYLPDNLTTGGNRLSTTSNSNSVSCIHLNGKTYNMEADSNAIGAIRVNAGTTVNIMDISTNAGTVIGPGYEHKQGSAYWYAGGAIDARGTVNIYGGTYMTNRADRPAVSNFGTSGNGSVVNMYGGKIVRNEAVVTTTDSALSSLVRMHDSKQTFNMYGGEISGGMAANGGNVRLQGGGNFNLIGGTIKNGEATNLGGNVCNRGGIFTMTGGTVKDADITGNNNGNASGGLFGLVSGTLDIQGGVVENGKANNGGLIYVAGGTLKVSGGELKNGTGKGGSIVIAGGTNTITGGTFSGGKTDTDAARDVTVNANKALTLGKDANIEKLYVGGTVTVQDGTVATVELAAAGRIAFADDVKTGTLITVIAPATQTIATVENANDYLAYFVAGVADATFAVKDGTTNEIVMTIPAQS